MPSTTPVTRVPSSTGTTMRYIAINSAVSTACTWLVWYYAGPIGGELARSAYVFVHGEPGMLAWASPGHWYKWGYDWGEDIGTKFVAVSAPLFYWLSNKIQNAVDRRLAVIRNAAEDLQQQMDTRQAERLRNVIAKFERPENDMQIGNNVGPAITAQRKPASRKSSKVALPIARSDKDSSSSSSSDEEKTTSSLTKKKKKSSKV